MLKANGLLKADGIIKVKKDQISSVQNDPHCFSEHDALPISF